MTSVSEGGYTWDAGPTAMLLPAVVRDLFRKSGRPVEDELVPGLEPLELVREHRFEDGSVLRLPGGSRTRQVAAFEELEPGLGTAWEEFTGRYAEVWEVLRRGYLEEPWDRDALPRRRRGGAGQPRDPAQAAPQDVPRRPARPGGRLPARGRRPRPAQRARLGRDDVLPRAALRHLDGAGRHAPAHRRPRRPTGAAWRHGAGRHRGARPRGAAGPGGRGAHRGRRGGGGRRGVRHRPAAPARAGAVRRAHHAGAAARHLPPRARRRPRAARAAARAGAARRPRARGAHRRHRAPGLRGVDAPRPRATRRGHAAGARPPPPRRPRPGRRPHRPLAAGPGAGVGRLTPRRRLVRPRHGARPARPRRPPSPASTPPAPTPPPDPASTTSASPPPSSPP